jgi:hypothetical protein
VRSSKETKFLRDSDGDFVVQFGYSDRTGCEINILIMASGSQSEICFIMGQTDKRIPKSDWGKAIMLCNTWNKEKRWPKAYLYVRDSSTDMTGTIHTENQIDLEVGVHQELLDHFILATIAGIMSFWQWAHQKQGL